MKVIILCGGKGMRLRPITENIPKPMVNLNGKPILEHIIDYFKLNGYNEFILAIGYKGDLIKEHFKDMYQDCFIEYSDAGNADLLDRIKLAAKNIDKEFIVVYGDTIANVDLKKLIEFTKLNTKKNLATITTYKMQSPFGIVYSMQSGEIEKFDEKPFLDFWINIGYMVIKPIALKIKARDLVEWFNELIKLRCLYEYKHTGKHITINTLKEMKKAEEEINYFYTLDGGNIK